MFFTPNNVGHVLQIPRSKSHEQRCALKRLLLDASHTQRYAKLALGLGLRPAPQLALLANACIL